MTRASTSERSPVFPPEQISAIRAELDAVLKSSYFSGTNRCQDFLELIVRRVLEGDFEHLTERFLGVELFGRPVDYETATDSIVRVRANDVRRRLMQYYAEQPLSSKLTICLNSGNYIPEFYWRQQGPQGAGTADSSTAAVAISSSEDRDGTTKAVSDVLPQAQVNSGIGLRVGVLIVLGLAIAFYVGWWLKAQTANRAIYPWRYSASLSALWSGFLDSNRQTDIVVSDTSFMLFEDIDNQVFSLDQYLNRSYVSQIQAQHLSPETQSILNLLASKSLGSTSEYRVAQRIMALDHTGDKIRVYNAREYSTALVNQDNVVIIGSQLTNPWEQMFENQLNFSQTPDSHSRGLVKNKAPKAGEKSTYVADDTVGYCVVAYLPNPESGNKVMLIEGSSSEATEAGGDFLISEEKLSRFQKMLHSDEWPYFEVLLKTSQVRGTPITATIEAYRDYSRSH